MVFVRWLTKLPNKNPLGHKPPRCHTWLGPRLVGRIASGVRVSASFQKIFRRIVSNGGKKTGARLRGLTGKVDLLPLIYRLAQSVYGMV